MSEHKLQVEAICRGTVIDHIPAGNGIKIVHRVQKLSPRVSLTAGLNLPSIEMDVKDLVKVDDWLFSEADAYEMALFAPDATINIIDGYQVVRKIRMSMPEKVRGVFDCLNPNCISHVEPVDSLLWVAMTDDSVGLRCHYCERTFDADLFS